MQTDSKSLQSLGGNKKETSVAASKKKNNAPEATQSKLGEEETELLSHLDESKLTKIKNEFLNRKEGLLLDEFLEIMLEHLEYSQDEKLKITMKLIDLFREIDVNGDEHLEWQEFSNHIIELGMLKKDRTVKEIIKNYYPSDSVQLSGLRQKHDSDIQKVYYFKDLSNIVVIEKDSPKVD